MRYWAGAVDTSPRHAKADYSGRLAKPVYNFNGFPLTDGLKIIVCKRPSRENIYLAGKEFRNDYKR